MKVALCALTGFGNAVFRHLVLAGIRPALVVTRKESGLHPYYPEKNLGEEAAAAGIKVYQDLEGESAIREIKPDLLLVATYHRILGAPIFSAAGRAVNLHPSLLPAYRGASPCYWVIRNGEKKTGVSAHLLTKEVDGGEVLCQRDLLIASDETQGTLRRKLAALAGEVGVAVARDLKGDPSKSHVPDLTTKSYFPKFSDSMREVNLTWEIDAIERHIRALDPWPGASLKGAMVRKVEIIERGTSSDSAGVVLNQNDLECTARVADGIVRFVL